jgi:small subunit ribosomal protein S6
MYPTTCLIGPLSAASRLCLLGKPPMTPHTQREEDAHPVRRYELMLLLRPDLEDDKLQGAVEKVTRAIVNRGGSLSKVSPWGKRRLAYDIGQHREASYFLIHFDIEPAQVREIERGMLISEEILRHLVTVIEDRGPADELVPAAAPRGATDEDSLDGDTDAAAAGLGGGAIADDTYDIDDDEAGDADEVVTVADEDRAEG